MSRKVAASFHNPYNMETVSPFVLLFPTGKISHINNFTVYGVKKYKRINIIWTKNGNYYKIYERIIRKE